MKLTQKRRMLRQGDVLLISVDVVPEGTKPIAREQGKAVLAHGEVTGHHHAIADPAAELLTTDQELVTADQAAELYLLVHGAETVELTHQEHATIGVPAGAYKVVRQREYAPEEIRRVAD